MEAVKSTAVIGAVGEAGRVVVYAAGADRWLLYVLRAAALGLGALHTFVAVSRQSMNEDGINYLDMGTAIVHGDWHAALNATWSPLYSIILGMVVHVGHPSIWWEFPAVQLANLVIFGMTMFCFEFYWRELTLSVAQDHVEAGFGPFPAPTWVTVGYSLWIWSSLSLIGIWSVTPDMLVAGCVYIAGGLLLRIGRERASLLHLVAFGAVLGMAYLAKAAMFPLGLVCLALAAGVLHWRWRLARRAIWSLGAFAVVAAPLVTSASLSKGHLTFGEVGRFTYMKHVNRLRYPHWEETVQHVNGVPTNPPRRVVDDPPVYEFATPVGGTYPMSFDPGFWTRGLAPRLDLEQQSRALASNGLFYFDLFVRQQGGFAAIVLLLVATRVGRRLRANSAATALVFWGVSAFALYSLVYVSPRYVAPFVVIFWSGLLARIRLPDSLPYRRLSAASVWLLVLVVWVNIAAANIQGLGKVLHFSPGLPSDPTPVTARSQPAETPSVMHPAIAEGLRQLGLKQGDTIGFIGYSFSAFWARLAQVRIIAELESHHAGEFWSAPVERQQEVLRAFAKAGATAVVSEPVVSAPVPPGWVPIGTTGYMVRFMPRAKSAR